MSNRRYQRTQAAHMGGLVSALVYPTESGYVAEVDRQRNYGDSPDYFWSAAGHGETAAAAVKDLARSLDALARSRPY